MRQASQASINPRSSPQGAIKCPHGSILPNWPRRAAQSRRDLRSRHPQTTPIAFLHGLAHSLQSSSAPAPLLFVVGPIGDKRGDAWLVCSVPKADIAINFSVYRNWQSVSSYGRGTQERSRA
jgi:hypothetical protein